jgi:hypothetical protein
VLCHTKESFAFSSDSPLIRKALTLCAIEMEQTIQLNREELYEQVWSIPMIQLAKQYQISDVGLAKICKKLKIPVPGRGYRATKGKKKRPPLLSTKGIPEFEVHKIMHDNPNLSLSSRLSIFYVQFIIY